jgi:hypothetical protein
MAEITLNVGEPNSVLLEGLALKSTGAFDNAATVAGQILTMAGQAVGDAFTLSYVTATDGNYRGTIPEVTAALLAEGRKYRLQIYSAGKTLRRLKCQAKYREEV